MQFEAAEEDVLMQILNAITEQHQMWLKQHVITQENF
jgi:hypothetical protein